MITNYPTTMTEVHARREARDILEEEANRLCDYGLTGKYSETFPHRVKIAVSREIQRLRLIAETLKGE